MSELHSARSKPRRQGVSIAELLTVAAVVGIAGAVVAPGVALAADTDTRLLRPDGSLLGFLPDLSWAAGYAVDALLAVLAFVGWKRAFDAEREAKREVEFYKALPKQWVRKAGGFTLIEMLVVITIMMILVAAAAFMFGSGTESRKTREAARMVNVYLSSARNRAIKTGRPCGVIFRNFGSPGFAMNADQGEVPPCYAGDTDTACAMVIRTGATTASAWFFGSSPTLAPIGSPATSNGDTLPPNLIRLGDTVQFGNQGHWYAITATNGTTNANGFVNSDATIFNLSLIGIGGLMPWDNTTWYREIMIPHPVTHIPTLTRIYVTPLAYRVVRSPTKSAATPLQLPSGSVVDLQWSGVGDDSIGSTTGDLTVMFSPTGAVDCLYYGNAAPQQVIEPIFLLIGMHERVGQFQASPTAENKSTWANWQDLKTGLWVTINPHTGVISTEPTASGNTYDSARSLARQSQGMGGR